MASQVASRAGSPLPPAEPTAAARAGVRPTGRHTKVPDWMLMASRVLGLPPHRGPRIQISSRSQQQGCDISMTLGSRPHQRRLASIVFCRIEVRPTSQQFHNR